MKLTIKELAPYLPYGIPAKLSQKGIFNLDEEYPNEMARKTGLIKNISFWHPEITGQLHITETYSFDFDELDEVDIILRPLSDLTKEIEGKSYWLLIEVSEMPLFKTSGVNLKKLSVKTYFNLLEEHFDVFGLIEKGLAIDINTLNQ